MARRGLPKCETWANYDLRLKWDGTALRAELIPLTLDAMKIGGRDQPANVVALQLELARHLQELRKLREVQRVETPSPRTVELLRLINDLRRKIGDPSSSASAFDAAGDAPPLVIVSAAESSVWGNTLVLDLQTRSSDGTCKAELEFSGPPSTDAPMLQFPGYGFDSMRAGQTMQLRAHLLSQASPWRLGFFFPTEALATQAQKSLRPASGQEPRDSGKQSATLFEAKDETGKLYQCRLLVSRANQDKRLDPNASPITSDINGGDDSPEGIAKAQQLGIAAAAKDIAAGNFRILTFGLEKLTPDSTDQETGYRLQSVAGTILGRAFQAECEAYNFAMRDHFQKHVRWVTPMPGALATKPGSYDLPNDLKLVITESEPGKAEKKGNTSAQLIWGASHAKPGESYEIQLSDGQPYAITWSADGNILWVTCSTTHGGTKELTRFFRTLHGRGPGEVDEELGDIQDATPLLKSRLPQAMREMMHVSEVRWKELGPTYHFDAATGALLRVVPPGKSDKP